MRHVLQPVGAHKSYHTLLRESLTCIRIGGKAEILQECAYNQFGEKTEIKTSGLTGVTLC